MRLAKALLEGAVYVFGWPAELVSFVVNHRAKKETVRLITTQLLQAATLTVIERKDGESDADMAERSRLAMIETVKGLDI